MARDYARIMTSIWLNKDFRALAETEQRMYLLLVSQPDISAAGVLPLRVRRWADMAATSTADALAETLKRLESGRFIAVDWDAEELLIRSFIRWDGGFNNPKRRPVIVRASEEVASPSIARHIATEFVRCGITAPESPPDSPPDRPSGSPKPDHISDGPSRAPDSASHSLSEINRVDPGSEPFPQVNSLSDSAPTNSGRVPQPTTHNPQPTKTTTSATADAATADDPKFGEFWTIYPRRVKKIDAQKAWRTVTISRKVKPARVITAARRHADSWRARGIEIEFVPHPGSWLRAGAYDDEPETATILTLATAPVLASFEDYRLNAAGPEAARLLGVAFLPQPQPPSDPAPARQWSQARAVEWIDAHETELRAVLAERRTG